MELLPRTTASEELFRVLRDEIVSGAYAPGEKLPPQRTLAREYGLNATTVREAIKRLEQLRLVEVRHGDAMRGADWRTRSEEHTSELQSRQYLVCRLLLEKKNKSFKLSAV